MTSPSRMNQHPDKPAPTPRDSPQLIMAVRGYMQNFQQAA